MHSLNVSCALSQTALTQLLTKIKLTAYRVSISFSEQENGEIQSFLRGFICP